MDNELLLLSKNDIPFLEAQVNIHQPTISEISLIGEEVFWSGCEFINFSKSALKTEDKVDLEHISDFEIFMSIMSDNKQKMIYKTNANYVLSLLFPDYQIKSMPNALMLAKGSSLSRIDASNFDIFKDIISSMFGLDKTKAQSGEYNPANERARKIAEKFKKAKELKNKGKDGESKVAILSRYASILAVGESKDLNDLMQYTVFQLKDEFSRYQLKLSSDTHLQLKIAGAQNLDDVDNWMEDIHS